MGADRRAHAKLSLGGRRLLARVLHARHLLWQPHPIDYGRRCQGQARGQSGPLLLIAGDRCAVIQTYFGWQALAFSTLRDYVATTNDLVAYYGSKLSETCGTRDRFVQFAFNRRLNCLQR
jgi:hypothetical protein